MNRSRIYGAVSARQDGRRQIFASGWEDGTKLDFLRKLSRYWEHDFRWRDHEERLNLLPQFRVMIDGCDIHFVHQKGKGPAPLPLMLTHGWPGSFAEFERVIPLLTDPATYGGDAQDAFDVVAPSLPGFGFSSRRISPAFCSPTSRFTGSVTRSRPRSGFTKRTASAP